MLKYSRVTRRRKREKRNDTTKDHLMVKKKAGLTLLKIGDTVNVLGMKGQLKVVDVQRGWVKLKQRIGYYEFHGNKTIERMISLVKRGKGT